MKPDRPSPTQATIDAMERRRLGQPKNVTITMHKNDFRLIVACLMIAQEKHLGILTWAQERAARNIAIGIRAELDRHN